MPACGTESRRFLAALAWSASPPGATISMSAHCPTTSPSPDDRPADRTSASDEPLAVFAGGPPHAATASASTDRSLAALI